MRSSAHMITSRTRRSIGSARLPFSHLSTSGSLFDMSGKRKAGGPNARRLKTLLLSALRQAQQAERRALRVGQDREPASREVLGAHHLGGAEVDRLLVGLVYVVGHE